MNENNVDMRFAINKEDRMNSQSVLPMKISKTGSADEPLSEIIICDSISGGARYSNNMPEELTLVRKLADGTEYSMRYKQNGSKTDTAQRQP